MASSPAPTKLLFHHDSALYSTTATVVSVFPASELHADDQPLFKQLAEGSHVVVTDQTVFHPQGGGQPSDTGTMKQDGGGSPAITFDVAAVRTSVSQPAVVLHVGQFAAAAAAAGEAQAVFEAGETVTQEIDAEKRLLYSRYHTAGHVLGAAVRLLLEKEVEGFDELKASHFPDAASCEFAGLIAGSHRDAVQRQVDDYVARDLPVEIDWWDEADFRAAGYARLVPDASLLPPGETRFRVVRIVGAEVYPCGGTHVPSTRLCDKTTVKKISRSKGQSRVSYTVS